MKQKTIQVEEVILRKGNLSKSYDYDWFENEEINAGYTKAEADANFLSGDTFIPTDFYSQSEADANFLSASTSFYTQNEADANFLSGNTVIPAGVDKLSELTDVDLTGIYDGDLLKYQAGTPLNKRNVKSISDYSLTLSTAGSYNILQVVELLDVDDNVVQTLEIINITGLKNDTLVFDTLVDLSVVSVQNIDVTPDAWIPYTTDFYTQSEVNANFLSGNTVIPTDYIGYEVINIDLNGNYETGNFDITGTTNFGKGIISTYLVYDKGLDSATSTATTITFNTNSGIYSFSSSIGGVINFVDLNVLGLDDIKITSQQSVYYISNLNSNEYSINIIEVDGASDPHWAGDFSLDLHVYYIK
jgi:hypothetical protein